MVKSNDKVEAEAIDLGSICDNFDITQIIEFVEKLKQVLEVFQPEQQAKVAGILDLFTSDRLQSILDLLQKIDIEKVMQIIRIVNTLIEKFRGESGQEAKVAMASEIKQLRANLRAVGGIRELLKTVKELQEVLDCLKQADILTVS